ncbi:hypothetical protein GPY61_08870 [Massilia sp. NEAU-DD11]|uniref:Uncharacterized protein n=1 Tax=Massilia cellulosiltytica TaxID=2683234 RepID=A0A7X3FXV1_9BURK|nr:MULTISPECIES: hypothetical protein [Telluria group]MVW60045.1 hypothetical protein [Telluria cellulosilytica]
MQNLTFEEIDMVSGAGVIHSMAQYIVGDGTGYAVGGFAAGVMEGMELGSIAGPVGILVGGAVGAAASYVFAHSLR